MASLASSAASRPPLLLDALKRLEYRGYDSAGIATLVNGGIERRRAEGKLVNLERALEQEPLPGVVGSATRWATHGAPTRDNAHPHQAGGVAVVHNGIIENFQVLRDELIAKGHRRDRNRHRGDPAAGQPLSGSGHRAGGGRRGGAEAAGRGVRAGHPVRRPRRPADRGTPGSPLAIGYGDGEMYSAPTPWRSRR